ncbi:MAG: hypothetical protein A2Z75_02750 [Chloroflexi bacterium RBG_13_50_10]|nr:MAG: hypothetical protein A2Z75_02750 [Chloroflexi bacterium RBG_13_50_10]
MTKLRAWKCFSVVMAMALLLGVGAIAVPAVPARAEEGTWDIQTVDDIDVMSTSLALDSNGYPHISYTTGGLTSLHYARWTGTQWVKEMVDDVPAIVTSLALDGNDLPHIGYTTFVPGDDSLHYARWTGTAWAKETVDESDVFDCSLALDSDDRPHISYSTIGGASLHYARWTGTAWAIETVDDIAVMSNSLALDSNDRPHISYTTGGTDSLHYARWTGTEWVKETVDDIDVIATSIALDSSDRPHISYATADFLGSLHYARWTGAAWAKETVDPADVWECSLALDSNNRPHISYFVGSGLLVDVGPVDYTGMLKYAHWTGSAWDVQTLAQETVHWEGLDPAPSPVLVGGGKWSSIALDSDDLPHISYGSLVPSATPLSLHYAHLVPSGAGSTVTGPSTGPRASTTPPHPLNPPNMTLQFLNVNPEQASVNEPVTITTNVVNSGDEASNYNVALKINGQLEQSRMVGVGPHGTQPVKFTVTKDKPGTYTVDIAGQNGSFIILGADSNTSGTTDSKTGALMVLALMGVLIIASVVVLLIRRT